MNDVPPLEAETNIYLIRICGTDLVNSGPPREARQPKLGTWLDFEKYKSLAAVTLRRWIGLLYVVLACRKSPVVALKVIRKAIAQI